MIFISFCSGEWNWRKIMNKILFEVSYIGSPSGFFKIMVFAGIWIIGLTAGTKRRNISNTTSSKINISLNRIEYIATFFLTVFFLWIVIGLIITYGETILGYKMGEYKEVEGVVENYEKHPWRETFTVNNVEFETEGAAISWGYVWQNGKSVITGDGQHLRIRYIPGTKSIVYIEQLKPE